MVLLLVVSAILFVAFLFLILLGKTNRWVKIISSILIIGLVSMIGLKYYQLNYADRGIYKKVTERNGYTLIKKDPVDIEFYIKSEWIKDKEKKEKIINKKVAVENNTIILLNKVVNRENDIYFLFNISPKMNYEKGNFIANVTFNEDGSITTVSNQIELYNDEQQGINIVQSGNGAKSNFGFAISNEDYDKIKDGFFVKNSNFSLYQYQIN